MTPDEVERAIRAHPRGLCREHLPLIGRLFLAKGWRQKAKLRAAVREYLDELLTETATNPHMPLTLRIDQSLSDVIQNARDETWRLLEEELDRGHSAGPSSTDGAGP